jgi:hypothetical protein
MGNEALDLGARFRTITSTVPTIPFDSGNVRSVELPRSFLYRNIAIRLSGSVTSGGAGAYTVNPEAPLGLIRKLELVADGRKVLWTAAARDLYRLAHLFRGVEGERGAPIATAAQFNNFSATIVVDNMALRMQLPADSLFDPREYEKIELRVTWGTVSDITTGGTAPAINTTTSIDVQVQQTTVGVEHVAFNRVIQFDEQTVSGASSNFTFNVPRSGLLAGILLRTDHSPATGATPIDTMINFVTLKSDNSFNHVDRAAWNTLKARNVWEFQMIPSLPATGALTAPTQTAPTTNFTPGYAYIDLTEDGLMTSCLNTLALNVLQLILDVSTAGLTAPLTVRATYLFFEPIRPLVGA